MTDDNLNRTPHIQASSEQANTARAQLQKMYDQLARSIASMSDEIPSGDHEEWAREMGRERICSVTNRPLDQVAAEHGLYTDELINQARGKRVLIIGAGNSTFAAELQESDPNTAITSVDIDEEALKGQPGRQIAASAEQLPLDDGSFDAVFMTYSLPVWAMSPEQARESLNEGVRMLAPGGKLYIAPIAQARFRTAEARTANGETKALGLEPDPRFAIVLREIDAASIGWLQTALESPNLEVALMGSLRYGDDFGGVLGATVTRQPE